MNTASTDVDAGGAQPRPAAKAGGKVILCGEHAVVHGGDALVVGLEQGVMARAVAGEWSLVVGDQALAAGDPSLAALRAIGEHLECSPAAVHLEVSMPLGVGLGGSAAMAVAIARALAALSGRSLPDQAIFGAAQVWERVFHGNPSGVDAAAATYGGCLLYNRDAFLRDVVTAKGKPTRVPVHEPLRLAIAVAGPPSSTRTMVERVEAHRQHAPKAFGTALQQIQDIVTGARSSIQEGDLARLGALMSRNHEILAAWDLSTPAIEAARTSALRQGAYGCKVTGAGGGGCVVALCNEASIDAVLTAWTSAGYPVNSTTIPSSTHSTDH